ncbi:hypothetical protein CKAN_00476400 [Cinnamomum micranthum f. kanehirae]|uniref:RNase H type-1 domain-containing protein n=1 Tax=Cinnamomum micranthum f. kanehirae TaxID=337451 RepID=A0A3S3Q0G0_9MAGN|nr:hypothetical protein CKAN_00476400 [Cinnamomum micranthum f. kanehirae]
MYAGPGSNLAPSPDWRMPPPPGWVKLNFDGSFNQATGKAGIGGLIRDPCGNMFMAFSAEVHAKLPLESEILVKELDVSNTQIEGVCLAIISTIQHSENLAWDLMPLWQETMTMLSSLRTWSIHYCKRSANSMADLLANLDILDTKIAFGPLKQKRDRFFSHFPLSFFHQFLPHFHQRASEHRRPPAHWQPPVHWRASTTTSLSNPVGFKLEITLKMDLGICRVDKSQQTAQVHNTTLPKRGKLRNQNPYSQRQTNEKRCRFRPKKEDHNEPNEYICNKRDQVVSSPFKEGPQGA